MSVLIRIISKYPFLIEKLGSFVMMEHIDLFSLFWIIFAAVRQKPNEIVFWSTIALNYFHFEMSKLKGT